MKPSGIIFIDKPPLLTDSQLKRLSEIYMVIGEVFFALVVITPLVTSVDDDKTSMVALGLVGAGIFWSLSILLVRKL